MSFALTDLDNEPLLRRAMSAAVAAGLNPVVVTDDLGAVRAALRDGLRDGESLVAVDDLPATLPSSGPVLVHDPLCPCTPPDFLESMAVFGVRGVTAVAVLPVTDTVKLVDGDTVRTTIDRSAVTILASPLAVSARLVVDAIDALLDLPGLVRRIGLRTRMQLVPAPLTSARVTGPSELDLLAAVYELHQQTRERSPSGTDPGPDRH
jgi:2-C-methyl-D-erythritol 4-phosphate cytidylyltransferase